MERLWGFFKCCTRCGSKLPPSDGHHLCLFCLEEVHRIDACLHCVCFSKQSRKNHAAQLQAALLKLALTLMNISVPQMMKLNTLGAIAIQALDSTMPLVSPSPKKKKKDKRDREEKQRKRHGNLASEHRQSPKKIRNGNLPQASSVPLIPLLQSLIRQIMGSPVGDCLPEQLLTFSESDLDDLELNQRPRISLSGHLSIHTIS